MAREPWFERKFAFDLPVARFPLLIERLRGTLARLEERTDDLPRELLIRHVLAAWSIQQNVGHLLDLEPLWLRRTDELFAGAAELAPTDLANRRTHEARHDDAPLVRVLSDFGTARRGLIARLAAADDEVLARSALHPRLRQPMRLVDLAYFVAEHDDHHLATITGLRRRFGVD
jgi:uncharacterized damage-inducible protein DinB